MPLRPQLCDTRRLRRLVRWVAVLLLAAAPAQSDAHPRRPGTPHVSASPADTAQGINPHVSFRVREWTVDDGLPEPIMQVAQTPDGYLWATTFDGLVRFDGVRFTHYTTDNTPAFRSHDLLGLYAARDGTLWTGGRDGWVYALRDGDWTAYDLTGILPRHWVQGFAEDADGTLWMISTGDIAARFDGTRWTRVSQRIRDIWTPFAADADGTVWTHLPARDVPGARETLLGDGVVARWNGERFVPAGGTRWQGFTATQDGPLFHRFADPAALQTQDGPVRVQLFDAAGTEKGWFWSNGRALARLVDRKGRVWVQRPRGGDGARSILTVERNGTELVRIEPSGDTWIVQVFEDRQGNVWVHSRSSGLLQITEEPFRRYTAADGVPGFSLRAVQEPSGAILVSSEWGVAGPNLAVIRDGTVTPRTFRPRSVPAPLRAHVRNGTVQLGHVTTDAQGQRWALAGRYLLRLDGDDASIAWSTGGPNLWTLSPDPAAPNALWLGDADGGVYRFDRERAMVTDRYSTDGRVYQVHRGPRERLWIGTEGGLRRVDATGTLTAVRDSALDGRPIRDLFNAPDGSLWAATEGGGLVRLYGTEIRALTTQHGLPSDHLSAVVLDAQGFFWLGGRQALYRLSWDDVNAVLDGRRGRVPAVRLLPSAGHLGASNKLVEVAQAADGSLWIPSFKGVTRLDPAQYAAQFDEPLPLHVEALATEPGGVQPLRAGMQLPVGARTVTLQYTAPDLRAPDLVRFRTRLRGRDTAWVDQGPQRSVTYGALPPDTYTFEVQAMNAGGVWNSSVATLAFTVPPRVTETWWFFGLCALGLLAMAALGNHLRVRSLVRRQRELNALVDERTRQLQTEKETVLAQADALRSLDRAKSRVFANVSHEFRTPLTLTLGPLDDLTDGLYGPLPSPVLEQVDLARRNARRVLDLINQLLDVARLEAGQVRLRARRLDLAEVVADVAQTFAPLAERKAITLNVRCPEAHASAAPPTTVWANPEHLQKILANLLSNALKFTPEGGSVRVTVTAQDDTLTVAVRDSGPGISAEDLPHVFDRFYRAGETDERMRVGSGIGLALTKELVDLHHGTITVESEEGFGSQFTVALPRGRDHLRPSEIADPNDRSTAAHSHGDSLPALALGIASDSASPAEPSGDERAEDDASDADDRTTVLLVDDNAEVRALLRRHLADDYRILEAADGADGLERARADLPDLVLSDVMMPEMDGVALCRALKSDPATEFIPVILLTARAEIEDRLEGLDEGADDYLTKPFNTAEVRARVRNLIRSRQQLRDRLPTSPGLRPADPDVSSMDRHFLEDVQSAIEAHMGDEAFTVTDLAEAVGLSRTHLYRRLQEVMDTSPSALIRSMRLQRAAQLLAQDAGSISEIAYAVGFKSVSHFSRSFREAFGHSPSAHGAETASASEPSAP